MSKILKGLIWSDSNAAWDECPERTLIRAVLYRAVCDYTQLFMSDIVGDDSDTRERRRARERYADSAREWINGDELEPFSFCWVCLALDLDPHSLRSNIETAYQLRRSRGRHGRQGRTKILPASSFAIMGA